MRQARLAALQASGRLRGRDSALPDTALRAVERANAKLEPVPPHTDMDFASGEPLYCTCRQVHQPERIYVGCDFCGNWFHLSCVGISPFQASYWIMSYACAGCVQDHGRRISVRANEDDYLIDAWASVYACGIQPNLLASWVGTTGRVPFSVVVPPRATAIMKGRQAGDADEDGTGGAGGDEAPAHHRKASHGAVAGGGAQDGVKTEKKRGRPSNAAAHAAAVAAASSSSSSSSSAAPAGRTSGRRASASAAAHYHPDADADGDGDGPRFAAYAPSPSPEDRERMALLEAVPWEVLRFLRIRRQLVAAPSDPLDGEPEGGHSGTIFSLVSSLPEVLRQPASGAGVTGGGGSVAADEGWGGGEDDGADVLMDAPPEDATGAGVVPSSAASAGADAVVACEPSPPSFITLRLRPVPFTAQGTAYALYDGHNRAAVAGAGALAFARAPLHSAAADF